MDDNKDVYDAKVINANQIHTNECMGGLNIPVTSISYDMKHRRRGRCLILNHQTFDSHLKLDDRGVGTVKDGRELTTCFKSLGFDVLVMSDPTQLQIYNQMSKIADEDHSDSDCLLVVVLTHGDEQNLYARDARYRTESLYSYFKANSCRSLIGKPKIFIIQACRGREVDFGCKLKALGGPVPDVTDTTQCVYKIPAMADILVYYSTAPGYVSWKDKLHGSHFIQSIIQVLNEFCYDKTVYDLVTLFTIVNQRVAYYFPDDPDTDQIKQIPCIQSMLTRLIFLTPKPTNS